MCNLRKQECDQERIQEDSKLEITYKRIRNIKTLMITLIGKERNQRTAETAALGTEQY